MTTPDPTTAGFARHSDQWYTATVSTDLSLDDGPAVITIDYTDHHGDPLDDSDRMVVKALTLTPREAVALVALIDDADGGDDLDDVRSALTRLRGRDAATSGILAGRMAAIVDADDGAGPLPVVGQRLRIAKDRDVIGDLVPAGSCGTVTDITGDHVSVTMDDHFPFLSAWDNDVVFDLSEQPGLWWWVDAIV